ncbi:MAG: metal-dependent hydrolase [Deltaproteobacteria bacterium]|nr:MAG: metal-dependent hydrolase [Deltaproteobacteria bacterium]
MTIKITTLLENSPGEHLGLIHEHGLCFFIETDECKILFDTGHSDSFLKNAEQLMLHPSQSDFVVLSHGHYDHSGGLRFLVEKTKTFKLFVGQGFFDEKYACRGNAWEFLGNNFDRDYLEKKGIEYYEVEPGRSEIAPGISVISGFPRIHEDEVINKRFKIRKNGVFTDDRFDDEVLLALDTPQGLIILLGCSHPGMKNMVDRAIELTGKDVYAILGGTHLVEAGPENLQESLAYLDSDSLKILGVSHCTGSRATGMLEQSNGRYYHNRTGSCLILD